MTIQHEHNRKSIRLKGYDYSQEGLYFITICCQDGICRFGHIENDEMICNQYGIVAYNEWMKTPQIRSNITLHEFVVMPNHIHGIIEINHDTELYFQNRMGELYIPNRMDELYPQNRMDELHTKSCRGELHSPIPAGVFNTPLRMRSPSQTIGAIVRGYKSAVTKQLNALGMIEKLWQRNYYEHIIRNEKSYLHISEYIHNNPIQWINDKFYNHETYRK